MKYLVTGGCGFVGTSFVSSVLRRDRVSQIRIYDNFLTGGPNDLSEVCNFKVVADFSHVGDEPGVFLTQGDVRDGGGLCRATVGVDCILHFAANTGVRPSLDDPYLDLMSNVIGTFNALEAARLNGVKRFIFASSGAPAGAVNPPIHEEIAPHPVSPYGASKLAGEGYCSAYFHSFGIGTVCLRFGNVFGPRSKNKASLIAKFIKQAIDGVSCEIYGDGTQTRDFIYIDDLVEAIHLAVDSGAGGEVFQIASGSELSVGEVANIVATTLERYGIIMSVWNSGFKVGDVMRNYADTSKARRILGWSPVTNISEGVERTVRYFLGKT